MVVTLQQFAMLGHTVRTALAATLSFVSLGGAFNHGLSSVQVDKPLSIGYVRPLSSFTFASYLMMGTDLMIDIVSRI